LISVATLIVADFTYSPAAPSVGEMVTFTATALGGTGPYSYSWTFGDGGAGQGQIVSRPYASPGTFTVILTVTDIAQRSTTVSKSIVITPVLAAGFTFSPTNPVIEEVVTFTATASGGTPPYTIGWTFGDGGTGTGGTATHAYASPGNFIVSVRVDDSVGHTVTVSKPIPVSPLLRTDFTYIPLDPVVGEDVDFTATTTGGTGPYTHAWSFGDGSTALVREVTHAYGAVGSYTVVLTVSDSAGHEATAAKVVPVRPALDTTLTVSQEHPITGEVVEFTANATGGTPPYTYRWDFGDGSNATGATAFYAYPTDGLFEVVATATDASGRRGVARIGLLVTLALSANFTLPLTAAVGDVLVFSAIVEGGTKPYNVTWTFGDGGIGVGPEVNHTYLVAGTFDVTVTVIDSANHTLSQSKPVSLAPALSATATFSPPRPAVAEKITFSANATGGTPPYRYDWAFGDGNVGAGPTVTYFYVNATTYNVTLNITDAVGRYIVLRFVVVTITNLKVDFAFDPGLPITGRSITFLPTVSGGVPPFVYAWTFGDGSTSSEERPTHLYVGSGLALSYTVELTVCDAEGHCVTASKGVTLVDWPMIANIGTGIAIASVIALWLVRRWRIGELDLKPAGRWVGKQASSTTRWVGKQASETTRGLAAWFRGIRNGRGRELSGPRRKRRNGRLKG
jgi:PKD repeat protein